MKINDRVRFVGTDNVFHGKLAGTHGAVAGFEPDYCPPQKALVMYQATGDNAVYLVNHKDLDVA